MDTGVITQNTDYTTLIAIFVGVIAVVVAIVTQNTNQAKRFDALNDKIDGMNNRITSLEVNMTKELTNLKIEMKEEFTGLKDRMGKVEAEVIVLSKLFGRFETDLTATNTKVDAVKEQVISVNEKVEKISVATENNSVRINKIETDTVNLFDKVVNFFTQKTTPIPETIPEAKVLKIN